MRSIWTAIQAGWCAIGGVIGWFIGGYDGFVLALVVFMVCDYITGILRACTEKKLSSRLGAKGIIKKVCIFIMVGIAHLVDMYLLYDGGALRLAVIFFYLSNEGVSVLENAAAIGLPVPDKVRRALAILHKKAKEEPQCRELCSRAGGLTQKSEEDNEK
jgi:toxin secretion/phage lysis holin